MHALVLGQTCHHVLRPLLRSHIRCCQVLNEAYRRQGTQQSHGVILTSTSWPPFCIFFYLIYELNNPCLEGEGFRKLVDYRSTSVSILVPNVIPAEAGFARNGVIQNKYEKNKTWISAFVGMTGGLSCELVSYPASLSLTLRRLYPSPNPG
jgi:hypothetical protein